MIYNKLRRKYNVKKSYSHDGRISIPDDCIPSRCQHHNNNGCQRQYPPELFLACSGLGIVFGIHVHVRKILISRAASRNLKNSLAYPQSLDPGVLPVPVTIHTDDIGTHPQEPSDIFANPHYPTLLRQNLILTSLTLLYFFLMANTFNVLGVVLPSMVTALHLSWNDAGFGFMLLGLACGLTSPMPAWSIRQLGIAATLAFSAIILAGGFACFALAENSTGYDAGAFLLGVGFTMGGTVSGTYVLARISERSDKLIAIYFTGGGLGAIAGPLLFLGNQHLFSGWRPFWWLCATITGLCGLFAAATVHGVARLNGSKDESLRIPGWPTRAALLQPAFWAIVASYTGCLAINTTMHSFAVQHLTEHGLSATHAAEMMSAIAFLGAIGSATAGAMAGKLGARILALVATVAMSMAAFSLALPQNIGTLAIFILSLGLGIGIIYVASAMLLLEYFGKRHNLELYATMCLLSTAAALGPWLGGHLHDSMGGFRSIFLILGACGAALSVVLMAMKAPQTTDLKN